MRVDAFDFDLDESRIAQVPADPRDASKLFVLPRIRGSSEHRAFSELPELLEPGDLLVVNDTRVIAARLRARRPSGGAVECLLVESVAGDVDGWWAMIRSTRKPRTDEILQCDGGLAVRIVERDGERWRVRLEPGSGAWRQLLPRVGALPLPPYIRRPLGCPPPVDDASRYQTVYAARDGAIAAPTAGLHFTDRLLERLDACGVQRTAITLHVGPGTFVPLRGEHLEDHRLQAESYEVSPAAAAEISAARARGRRVVAVGTTVVRALESAFAECGEITASRSRTNLFITPGHSFRVVDALITNFHLPRSSLLVLVAAFARRERVLDAYREAIARGYRFYSYGDAMLIRS